MALNFNQPLQQQQGFTTERDGCLALLQTSVNGEQKYQKMLQEIANRTTSVAKIDLDDVLELKEGGESLAEKIEVNTLRVVSILSDVIDELLPEPEINIEREDTIDVLMHSRRIAEEMGPAASQIRDENIKYPKELTRRYEVHITPRSDTKPLSVRTVGAGQIGHLVTVAGVVTRISDVQPLVRVATYTCDACGYEIYQVVSSKSFMPMGECTTGNCVNNRFGEKLHMQTRGSKFLKFQQVTLQENPDQVPVGSIPRSMKVVLRGEATRQCTAGDKVTITGIYLPEPYTGFQAMKAGLTSSTYLECMVVTQHKKGYRMEDQSPHLLEEVEEISNDPDTYGRLAKSLAPEIYGLEDEKKALLLQLVSGVTKSMADGMKIRGDINILLMGDPGVAKSQLLKHIASVAPRAIYTTGKGSSGVGLTAAVIKDQSTGEMILEGGALVLSDMGICCIDEFDKMEDSDRTAIHEVMEQQTVSIAKAGITTTLNARTAILAAANPVFGRYDRTKMPEENIILPAALMSRFDLMFVMVDTPDRDNDISLARHITYVHQHKRHPPLDFEPLSSEFIRTYIAKAREFEPSIPPELTQYIVGSYVQMRTEGRDQGAKNLLGTPRTLLSILRLSQALARLRLSDVVAQQDVEEATRLMYQSKASLLSDESDNRSFQDVLSRIYIYVKEYMQTRGMSQVRLSEIEGALVVKGFSAAQIKECIEKYEDLDVWMLVSNGTALKLTDD